ncbi:hypothetical protein L8P27_19525 [Enterobacter asburiae]|uniref:hypothetical protein n=1 Tax=Enterobacter asburiae TaxID=61645 RepID=UPI002003CCD5|nr:hypothetical protein [Enterobacter asburiae]MCK7229997.1 hypothetical protein [Enterobacter asburiae]
MNKHLTIITWVAACLVSLTALFLFFYHKHTTYEFSCQGEVTSKGSNAVVRHLIAVNMERGEGRFDIIDQFTPSETQAQKKIINTLFFHYSQKDNRVMMVSETENQYADYLRTETIVPDFFLRQNRGLALKMIPVNKSAYLFIDGNTPVFFCKKMAIVK